MTPKTTTRARTVRLAAALAVTTLGLSACQIPTLQTMTLPGGNATGGDVIRITVVFDDVLDLVPQSSVQINNVAVGDVESVSLDGFKARVVLRVKDTVDLPENAVARLQTTSLLGEKYVALSAPLQNPSAAKLSDGDVIANGDSSRDAEIEEVLSALSLLLNGGGVEQLQSINTELSTVLQGREADVKSLLTQLNVFVGGLDAQKSEIVRALDGLDKLSRTLAAQRTTIATALDDIAPGLKVITSQEEALKSMLTALSDLGAVGVKVINDTQDDTVANLALLRPILQNLVGSGVQLPKSLELLTTYPFPKTALVGPRGTLGSGAIRGDFAGLYATLDANLQQLLGVLESGGPQGGPGSGGPPTVPAVPGLPALPLPGVPTLPALPVPVPLPTAGLPLPGGSSGTGTPLGDLLTGGLR